MGQIEDMQAFVAIIDAGTISRAAQQMGMAKSAVSRRLSDLETRLNVQLLNRTTRKSSLTDAGRLYYQRARQIIDDVNELHTTTSNAKATLEGDLKVALPLSFGLQHLTPAINEFATLHQGINFILNFSDHQVDIVEEGFDIAIRIAELKDSSHIAKKLTSVKLITCASPEYLKNNALPVEPADLRHHDILEYNHTGAATHFIDPRGKAINLRLTSKLVSNNGDYLCAAVSSGLGISFLPTFMVWKHIQEGSIIPILKEYQLPSLSAYAIYPQTRHLSQRVRLFIDFLVEKFGTEPHWDQLIYPEDEKRL